MDALHRERDGRGEPGRMLRAERRARVVDGLGELKPEFGVRPEDVGVGLRQRAHVHAASVHLLEHVRHVRHLAAEVRPRRVGVVPRNGELQRTILVADDFPDSVLGALLLDRSANSGGYQWKCASMIGLLN